MNQQPQDDQVAIEDVLASMREVIGVQAQEIAVLRATIATLKKKHP